MFNFFKKTKTESDVIAAIHNEFDTAEDRLLEQADLLLKELKIPTETGIEAKANKLRELGFVNSEIVVQANVLSEKRDTQTKILVETKEQTELIRYYKNTYPFQKFLTEGELNRICEKYGLVYAPVKNYVKDVPEKNIKQIQEAAILKHLDNVRAEILWIPHNNNIKKKCPENVFKFLEKGVPIESENHTYMVKSILDKLFGEGEYVNYTSFDYNIVKTDKSGLFIAAPKSHFNLSGLSQKNKYSFLHEIKKEVKDPIVFRYCRGGVQVLSKWGLEANDESLINEINN